MQEPGGPAGVHCAVSLSSPLGCAVNVVEGRACDAKGSVVAGLCSFAGIPSLRSGNFEIFLAWQLGFGGACHPCFGQREPLRRYRPAVPTPQFFGVTNIGTGWSLRMAGVHLFLSFLLSLVHSLSHRRLCAPTQLHLCFEAVRLLSFRLLSFPLVRSIPSRRHPADIMHSLPST